METVKICKVCGKDIVRRPTEILKRYLKRQFHKECQYKGMKEGKVGFFNQGNKPIKAFVHRFAIDDSL